MKTNAARHGTAASLLSPGL